MSSRGGGIAESPYLRNYRVGKTLGHGSFGKVKIAEHLLTGHKVAIKILNRRKMKTPDMEEKLKREIKICRLFVHPHVIRLYEVIETPTDIYVVMEYVKSGELFDYIVEKGRLQEDEARKFFQQIIAGVEYCHRNMVVHRDLKPENLLLDARRNVKIADFGLGNIMRDGHFLKTSCGSPNYAAPEVVSGKLYAGPEVDVWSCGVILYALLCGTLPFDDENIPNLFKKIKSGVYTLPSHLSPLARDLIPRMLIVDPMKRISVPDIRQHQWFKIHLPRYLAIPPPDARQHLKKLDEEILQQVSRMGLDRDQLLESLQKRIQDDATVAYYLLYDNRSMVSSGYLGAEFQESMVSIQRIQDSADQSVVEDIENAKVNSLDRSLRSQLSNSDFEATVEDNSIEDDLANKPASQNAGKNGNCRTSSESDITLSSSGSSSGLDTPCEVPLKNNTGNHEQINIPSSLNHALVPFKQNSNVSTTVHEESPDVQWEWMGGSAFEASTDASAGTPKEALLLRLTSQEDSDVVEKLKTELIAMARQADMTDLELQTLRKQIIRESKRGMDLSKEVASLKEERDDLKEECDKHKASQRRMDDTRSKDKLIYDNGDIQALVDELRQELNYQKDLNSNLQIQLQKTQESNSELILAVRDLDEMLEQKNQEIASLPNKSMSCDDAEKFPDVISNSKHDMSDEDDEEQKALEQLVREHTDAKDTHVLEQKIMDLHGEIEIYRRDRDELEMQMEQLALDYEILKQENHDMSYRLEQSELQEQLKMQYECSSSYATVGQLEAQIDSLENELKKQSEELSDSLVTISELEAQVRNLEDELEKQAQEFEADLSMLTRDKVEQEQRAIRAEEALRKTRWQNASTAERLQEEFKRLSIQMASTFEANEKLASKALNEANEFRLEKMHLENMLRKSSEELQSIKDHHEVRVFELSSQVSKMSGQIEKLQTEIEEKSLQIQNQEEHAKESQLYLSQKIIILEAEIENLLTDKKISSDHEEQKNSLMAELDKMRTSIKDMELLVEQGRNERSELETKLASVRKEADESLKELNNMRSVKDEKEALARKLHSEVDNLKSRCNEMKRMLFEDEVEKEKLKKQVSQLKGDLKKKEDALNGLDKKLKDANSRVIASNGMKTISKNNKSIPASAGSREVASLKEKIKLLEGQIKRKESALESSTNSFLEKERDLQDRIEELDKRLEELSQNAERISEQESRKVVTEVLSPEVDESSKQMLTRKSCSLNKEMEALSSNTRHLEELSGEIELLKGRNTVMEDELMEMQERYSELSLKFAEVEGERQQLVMKLRNAKKNP